MQKNDSKNGSKKWEGSLHKSDSKNNSRRWADGTASPWDEESLGSRRWHPLQEIPNQGPSGRDHGRDAGARNGGEAAEQGPPNEGGPSTSGGGGLMGLFARRKQS